MVLRSVTICLKALMYTLFKTELFNIFYLQIQVTNPSLHQPLKTKLQMNNQRGQYITEWVIDMGSPVDGASFKLSFHPEGGTQSFAVGFNLKEILELLNSVECLVSSTSSCVSRRETPTQALYGVQYKHPEPYSHTVSVISPSRTIEAQVACTDSGCTCKCSPNKGRSPAKYELYAKHTHSEWTSSKFEGRFSHPSLSRDQQIEIEYVREGHKVTGNIVIDIFQNPEDKITGKLNSTVLSRNTVDTEAQLSGKVRSIFLIMI